jgi:tetratricopeptide (TPR) repeat protein
MNTDQDRLFKQLFPLDDKPGPARIAPSRAQAVVENALDTWQQEVTKAPRRSRSKMVFLAAAIVAFASAAAGLFHAWTVSKEPQSSASTQPSRISERASDIATPKQQLEPESPFALSDSARRSTRTRETKREAEDLLQTANQQRQQGRWRDAERTYRRVSIIYPKSPSAYVALIAAASIRLEHLDDARGALTLYNQALQIDPRGSLDIEARMGIARVWQRLEKREREIKSLRHILRKYDSGPMVQQAKQRLEVISRGD